MQAGAQETKPPRSIEAIAASPTEIRVYWLPIEGATGYKIVRDGQPLTTLPADSREFSDTGLSPDSTHSYVVQAQQGDQTASTPAYTERTFAPFPSPDTQHPPPITYDVVIMQASSGGVAAAVEAARRGLKVVLIEPTTRLGGMPVNGLSASDLRRPAHASGFFVRFRDRVRALYAAEGIKTDGLQYEPRIAHQAMKSLLYEVPNLTILRRARLTAVRTRITQRGSAPLKTFEAVSPNFALRSEPPSTPKREERRRVEAVVIEELGADGQPTGRRAELRAKVFVDATDSGDLAAWAGAPFRVGREARSTREPHNGLIYYDRTNDAPLPGSTGEADKRIQSYAYLLTVKDYGPNADKTIAPPPGYRKEDFIHSPDWRNSWAVTSGKMPNGKYELNQHPEGNDLQAINYAYPTGDYRERERVEKRYRNRIFSYLYYIQTALGQKQIGLPDDEYRDTGGFPSLLYVREGRRIEGEQTPVEMDITEARQITRPESIGLGDYPMDSHAVRPKTDWTTPDMGEGEWWLYKQTPWYELPLGVTIPRTLDNVFVTTAVSSTHVSFGTFRLEPVRMAFGQAAAAAADLCIRYGLRARDVPAREIQEELLPRAMNPVGDENIFLSYMSDLTFGSRHYRAIQYLAPRGFKVSDEQFKPDATTTRSELARWLRLLAERAAPPNAFYPYSGPPADPNAVKALGQLAGTEPVTRAEVARWLARLLPAVYPMGTSSGRYADIADSPDRAAIEALYAGGIDSRLWDGTDADTPDGKLDFKPDAPLSHADMFATLYAAQRNLGPLFNDAPIDGKNGRFVPPAP